MNRPRVLIVDDQPLVQQALRLLVQAQADMEAIGGAATADQAVQQAHELTPDLIVMDLNLGADDGLEVSRRILRAAPETRIILLSGDMRPDAVNLGIKAGVRGFVLKSDPPGEFLLSLHQVAHGKTYLSSQVSQLMFYSDPAPTQRHRAITPRERDVLKLTAEGLRLKEIAARLGIGARTVETHRAQLMRKLGCSSSSELTRYAIREGILPI